METKIALLKEWAKAEGVELPGDVARYLAGTSNDRRELEGLLIRVVCYSSLTGERLPLRLVREIVQKMLGEPVH